MGLVKALKVWSNKRFYNKVIAMGEKKDVKGLIRALGHKYWRARSIAAEALSRIGDNRAVEPLMLLLRDPEYDVRREIHREESVEGRDCKGPQRISVE